ncbi:HEPN-associated N-terminal domain-containing protein [Arthrobacter sp. AET 35A]|uniref:HEPN-associated N-terminal domain-containing protein n=1 Tax=Arthrobacter sp. AET 35A TaxID=2292643 RepID=UPI00178596FB|nr:HEPN-associated N-terminal domain-containing protein [Arthrobacter sp. AET 35A]MBE0011657.1 hypothetical protein [Arthrobacter sp. AET 35A]
MGGYKNQQLTEWDQGVRFTNKRVCSACVNDADLSALVQREADSLECDYCGSLGTNTFIAAPVDVLADAIHEGFQTEYGDPDDEAVGYDGREGGYQLPVYDTWDLLDEFNVTDNTSLRADLSRSVAGPWCQLNPYRSSPVEALSWGWSGFRRYVAKVPREKLHVPSPDADQQRKEGEIPPEDMLAVLTATIKQGELTRVLPAGTRWFRSRPHAPADRFSSAKDLGSPPPGVAKTNRMSAAGDSVFYGAKTRTGVLAEIKGYTSSE